MRWFDAFVSEKKFIWYLVFATVFAYAFPRPAAALLVPTEVSGLAQNAARQADLQKVQKMLESKIVRERLADMGMNPNEIQSRLSQLSDEELHQVAVRADKMHAGADSGLGILVTLLVIGVLVLLFLYLAKRV